MSLADDLERIPPAEAPTLRQMRRAQAAAREAQAELDELRERVALLERIDSIHADPPEWQRRRGGGGHRGIVCFALSDTHLDEVVRPEEVDGLNAYSRAIAEKRLRRAFERSILLARDYVTGVEYDGCVLFLPGDMLSGTINDELRETNEGTLYEALLYWVDPLAAGIHMLARDFGNLTVACVVGNHGRASQRPRAKRRAQDNADWLLYRLLARECQEASWLISDAADLTVPVYGTTYLLTHGDQFRGGSGISALMSPLMLGQHRKTRRAIAAGRPYDHMVLGHWHTYFHGLGLIASGALKGFDEFAYTRNYTYEPPRLAWWITTPERGATLSAPVEPMDRKSEGW